MFIKKEFNDKLENHRNHLLKFNDNNEIVCLDCNKRLLDLNLPLTDTKYGVTISYIIFHLMHKKFLFDNEIPPISALVTKRFLNENLSDVGFIMNNKMEELDDSELNNLMIEIEEDVKKIIDKYYKKI